MTAATTNRGYALTEYTHEYGKAPARQRRGLDSAAHDTIEKGINIMAQTTDAVTKNLPAQRTAPAIEQDVPPCPGWCDLPDGHPWEPFTDGELPYRYHSRTGLWTTIWAFEYVGQPCMPKIECEEKELTPTAAEAVALEITEFARLAKRCRTAATIADVITAEMASAAMTLPELAAKVDLSTAVLKRRLNGSIPFRTNELDAIAVALHTDFLSIISAVQKAE